MTIRTENPASPVRNAFLTGGVAGAMDTLFNYPTYSFKIRRQSNQPFIGWSKAITKPTYLYQGALPYAATIIPTTGIQIGLDSALGGDKQSSGRAMASAMISGATGAIYCTASEHIILTQQKLSIEQKSLVRPTHSIKFLLNNFGILRLWTGYPANALRDMMFAIAMLRGPQIIDAQMGDTTEKNGALWKRKSKYAAGVIATGILCSTLSHPVDTISTKQQSQTHPISMFLMAKKIYTNKGFTGFYPGFLFRVISVTGSLFIMPATAEYSKNYLINR